MKKRKLLLFFLVVCLLLSSCVKKLNGEKIASSSHSDFSDVSTVCVMLRENENYKKYDFKICHIAISFEKNTQNQLEMFLQRLTFRDDHHKKMITVNIDCIENKITSVGVEPYSKFSEHPDYQALNIDEYKYDIEQMKTVVMQQFDVTEQSTITDIVMISGANEWAISVAASSGSAHFWINPTSGKFETSTIVED